ncbi:MAG TPA: TonB-dependent receptor [Terracidiphilus sp.]|nr:TonB-dependent receptor [Terracidiphilus sp.]
MSILKKMVVGWSIMALTAIVFGQGITTGTVQGTVADPSSAVVVGAQLQLKSDSSGLVLTTSSSGEGAFKFLTVPVGTYKLIITAQGFSAETVNNVVVQAGATTNLNQVTLRIGTAEQVEVNGSAAALLETVDSQVTTTFASESIRNLPLNNGFDTIAEVIPGVVSTGGRTYGDDFSNQNGDNFSVNGQSGRFNNFEIDGQDNNDNSIGGPDSFFSNQDAIEEIQVITNDYSAQYGRNAGAVVNYITKSGTNTFHGSGFEYYQGQFLSSMANYEKSPQFGYCPPGVSPSTGCLAPDLPRYVENRYGGSFGGPILKNRLFFFGSTYWDPIRAGATPAESLPFVTPDPTGLKQLEAAFPGNPGVAALANFGPFSIAQGNPQPIANSISTEAVTGPGGKMATIEVAGVSRNIVSIANDQEELGRLDWQPTSKDHMFVRYFYQPQLYTGIPGNSGTAAGDWVDVPSTTHSVGADWSHAFSTNLVDQLRYSFEDSKVFFQGGAFPDCLATKLGACPTEVSFNGTNDDSNFGGDVEFPQGRTIKVTQVQNNATWTRGAQTLLFGGEFDYENSPNVGLFYYNGNLSYGTLSNLLQNGPGGIETGEGILANGDPVIPFTEPDFAAYFQDDWKASPSLTLHLGLRWEFFSQALNQIHNQTVARESNPSTAIWPTTLPLADRTAGAADQNYKNFEPRIGVAWNPQFDRKLVVRAGYAINANPAFYNMFLLEAGGAPVVNTGAFPCGGGACLPSNGSLLSPDVRAANLPFLPTQDPRLDDETTFPSAFRTPYVQTYTLGIDHQFGGAVVAEARYVGSKTTDNFQSIDANPYLLPVAMAFPKIVPPSSLCSNASAAGYGRLNCNFSNVSEFINGGWADYNGLQLNLNTQNFHGLTSTISYTWSKALDNATDGFRSTGAGGSTLAYAQNPLNTNSAERGLSGNDYTNVVGLQFTYAIPGLTRHGSLLSRVTDGFLLSGVYRYTSGEPYTPYQPLDIDPNNGDTSFCDGAFNSSSVGSHLDTCRLAMSNKKAPINTVAYLNPYTGGQDPETGNPLPGTPQYVVYGSDGFDGDTSVYPTGVYSPGTPVDPATTHWIINNQAYALAVNNPYPGSGRSTLRGQPFSEFDATITKTTKIAEGVSLQLSLAGYNVLNQMYLGPGVPDVASSAFTSNMFNFSGTSAPGNSSGNRFFILGAKVLF